MFLHRIHATHLAAVLFAALLSGLLLAPPGSALAQTRLHPALFALSVADFPPASQVVRAGVEGNRRLLGDQALHFGLPPAIIGRLTGYYMDAIEGDPTLATHPYTSYLVSIFHSARQAERALDLRWDTWFAANYYTSPAPPPIALGDQGDVALFHTLDPNQPPLTELMFRRGAVLVEVFQGTGSGAATTAQSQAFYSIATKLDEVAYAHPFGA